ncbi:MAG: roadblock/LC7 domain-containing protein [Cellvibrionales bacterium]|nr:roadblock/LC7 domain-containing protein [Cellvibrionales bacterium]
MLSKDVLVTVISPLFDSYLNENEGIEVICLATTDGFPVHHVMKDTNTFEADKMAAASSTLYSVSNAVTQQILDKQFKITFIEAEEGNIAFVAITIDDKNFVLAMSARQSINIASHRMLINRMAKEIIAITYDKVDAIA